MTDKPYAVITADWDESQIFIDLVRAEGPKEAEEKITKIRGNYCCLIADSCVYTPAGLRRVADNLDKMTQEDSDRNLEELRAHYEERG